jgi:hypothetical protein
MTGPTAADAALNRALGVTTGNVVGVEKHAADARATMPGARLTKARVITVTIFFMDVLLR